MKIKMFTDSITNELEVKVNAWISDHEKIYKILDVTFKTTEKKVVVMIKYQRH
ncbi:hypothetical protein [Chryseobacterium sp. SNU WT5]|uniref:hypothetical protein n=1 Tax=Chryseobacterium sp. SNU WT5 TaxID=2594269 RepID=UPI00162752F6|nr:hypothetical protein [Chryseobacterium sp. SNU WT5]